MTRTPTDADKRRHDVRNQLSIIDGYTLLLLADTEQGHPHCQDLERIHRAAVAALMLLGPGSAACPPS